MSNDGKLYVKATCSVCLGKQTSCFYCDAEGQHFIEAADTIVLSWLQALPQEKKKEFLEALEVT